MCVWQTSRANSLLNAWIQQELCQIVFQREVILDWSCQVILWNELKGWELKRFSILNLRIYTRESLSVKKWLRSASHIKNRNQMELYLTGPTYQQWYGNGKFKNLIHPPKVLIFVYISSTIYFTLLNYILHPVKFLYHFANVDHDTKVYIAPTLALF